MQELATVGVQAVHDVGVVELTANFSLVVRRQVSLCDQLGFVVRVAAIVTELASACLQHVAAH